MHQRHSATLTTRPSDGPDHQQPESAKTKGTSLSDASLPPGSSLLPISYNGMITKKTWKRRRKQRNGGSTACCPAPRKRLHHGMKNGRSSVTRYDPMKVFGCMAIFSLVLLWIHSPKSTSSREDQQKHHHTHWTDDMIQEKRDKLSILREEVDSRLENTPVHHQYSFEPIRVDGDDVVPYDVFNCPEKPPQGYPYAWKILDILDAWPPDDPTPRAEIHQGLCVFDYQTEKEKAYAYRDAHLPFVVQNDPHVLRTARRWNDLEYMNEMMGKEEKWAVHYSESNHFMYWRNDTRNANSIFSEVVKRKFQDGWDSPTQKIQMSFQEWTDKALSLPETSTISSNIPLPHWYLMLNSNDCNKNSRGGQEPSKDAICRRGTFLDDELPFLNQSQTSLYIVEANKTNTPIECRFGMRDVIAENHFDMTRNTIALLSGERRYILNHPNQCKLLSLYPRGHPSARHSAVNWSNPDLESFPKFQWARANEVVLQAGDVLYLPTNWFHYIVSLSKNYQCNARSGMGREYERDVKRCGFSRPIRLGGMEK